MLQRTLWLTHLQLQLFMLLIRPCTPLLLLLSPCVLQIPVPTRSQSLPVSVSLALNSVYIHTHTADIAPYRVVWRVVAYC